MRRRGQGAPPVQGPRSGVMNVLEAASIACQASSKTVSSEKPFMHFLRPALASAPSCSSNLVLVHPHFRRPLRRRFQHFRRQHLPEARLPGISQAVICQALSGVTQDPAVLAFDRRQRGTFNKSFEQYVSTRVGPGRINAAGRCCSGMRRCCRASSSSSACRRRSWSRSGGWRSISARATSARCR